MTFQVCRMWDERVREATREDLPFLREMLFEAVYWRPDQTRPPIDEGLAAPELSRILEGWGRVGDTARIAVAGDGAEVGGAWLRYWTAENRSYGFVDASTPELGLAVRSAWRRRGVGTRLIVELMDAAQRLGAERISLSVEPENPSRLLYERLGFEYVTEYGGACTMVKDLLR